MSYIKNVKEATRGNERMVLETLGMELPKPGRHGPCPGCGGKDRFRMDKDDSHFFCSRGTGITIHGDIFDLIRHVTGWGLPKTVGLVGEMLGVEKEREGPKGSRYKGKHWSEFRDVSRAVLVCEIAARDEKMGKHLSAKDKRAREHSGALVAKFIKEGGLMQRPQEEIQDYIDILKRAWALYQKDMLPPHFIFPPLSAAEAIREYIEEGGTIKDDMYPHEWFEGITKRNGES